MTINMADLAKMVQLFHLQLKSCYQEFIILYIYIYIYIYISIYIYVYIYGGDYPTQ